MLSLSSVYLLLLVYITYTQIRVKIKVIQYYHSNLEMTKVFKFGLFSIRSSLSAPEDDINYPSNSDYRMSHHY